MPTTRCLPIDSPEALPAALHVLKNGGLVAFPTDTVYGLGVLMRDSQAIERLFLAKGRDFNKAIAVLIGALEQLDEVAAEFPPQAQILARRFWPGALTLVVAARPDLPANLSPLPTVGVRMPDHAAARALLTAAGPLATTSANRSGQANPLTAQDVLDQLDGRLDLLLDGGPTPGGVPSTVVDCTQAHLPILRQGHLTAELIADALSQKD